MTKTDSEKERQLDRKQKELLMRVKRAVKEGVIFRAHDRSALKASHVSDRAGREIDHLHSEKD